ncbi:MAG: hypothetical protein MUC91_08485 [Verrucomicrobia bacterium]|jgi:hypothetical protein|nr:hypothetical protein [Verrucomicrobiota bacterium]
MSKLHLLSLFTLLSSAWALSVEAQQPEVAARVAEVKANIAASQTALRQYEWIETTVVDVKGEEKSQEQQRCYYGADGGIQRIEINESSTPGPKFGLRKRIAEHEKKEMTDYIHSAVALVKSYVPPDAAKIQAAKDAGNVSLDILDPGKRIRLSITNYEKPGDTLGLEVDLTSNRLLGLNVNTYIDDASKPVTLDVRMGRLDDGTSYPATSTLNAPDKKLEVVITNTGYRKNN